MGSRELPSRSSHDARPGPRALCDHDPRECRARFRLAGPRRRMRRRISDGDAVGCWIRRDWDRPLDGLSPGSQRPCSSYLRCRRRRVSSLPRQQHRRRDLFRSARTRRRRRGVAQAVGRLTWSGVPGNLSRKCSRRNWSSGRSVCFTSKSWSSQRSNGSIGSTTAGFSSRSETFHRWSSKQLTISTRTLQP